MTEGKIHSIETMGLVDGPGIRTVVFLQGCFLRCRYCHNPDTWAEGASPHLFTPQQLVKKLCRYKTYYSGTGGGVTFSGGEPLLQPDFLSETLRLCRNAHIHTCLDTAGRGYGDYDVILENTDLVLYDVKHYTPKGYLDITGQTIDDSFPFLEAVRRNGTPLWVRHVTVPGLTDCSDHLKGLAEYIRTLPNVQRVELLGYHRLGVEKYHRLGIPYTLEKTPAMDETKLTACRAILSKALKQ